jgi:2,3-dihydroxybiphenyl 1,2-dioxygenase
MTVQALGYVGVRAKNLEDWAIYGANFLGLQRIDKSRSSMAFRMDDRKQRLVVDADGGQGIGFFGWEVADAAALDGLAARLEANGTKVARGSRALADERHVKDLVVTNDPAGNRLEFFHGAAVATEPFKPGRNVSGFRTGPLGMGHVVMHVERLAEMMPFYQDVLEFKLSDYWMRPFPGYFFHVNPRHHSFAMMESGKNMCHHMMVELFSFDDVGQGYDLALADQDKIAVTLGRHSGDYVTSFYTWNPSGFLVEYGWGGQVIDDNTWVPFERKFGPSLWGHDRRWMSPEKREESRLLCIESAENGQRQPVQVIDGNYNRMAGVCPWLDSVKGQQKVG